MQLQLVTLAGVKLDEAVYEVILPTTEGVISVFPSHEALVTVAVPGVVTVRRRKEDSDDELEYFAISGGVVEINQERVRILVDEAEHGDDIRPPGRDDRDEPRVDGDWYLPGGRRA